MANVVAHHTNSLHNEGTPSPWLTRILFTQISLKPIFKKFPFLTFKVFYETEIPSLTRITLHVVLTNLVDTNFAGHDFFQEPKVALN